MPRVKVEYRSTEKAVFKRFKEKHPDINIDYTTWCNVIYSFNYAFRDYCLETGMKGRLPYGFGDFAISKKKPKRHSTLPDGREVIHMPVDWVKTKKHGKYIYHMNNSTEGFKFKWKWFNTSARFFKAEVWNFKPSRLSSRLIKHYVSQENYQHKYLEWVK